MQAPRPHRAIPVRGAALAVSLAVAAAVAVALALLLPGNGKPALSKPAYSRALTARLDELAAGFRRAGPGGATQGEASAALRRMKASLDRTAARVAKLAPPDDAAGAQAELVGELRDYARQVDLVRASVDFGDPATIVSHLRGVDAPRRINRTLDSLVAKGYDIPVRVASVRP